MRARHVWIGAAAAMLALACGSGNGDEAAAPPVAKATANATEVAYLAALKAIDPALAEQRSAVSNGENICQEVEAGKDAATLAKNAGARFDVDAATGAKIVAATKASLCG